MLRMLTMLWMHWMLLVVQIRTLGRGPGRRAHESYAFNALELCAMKVITIIEQLSYSYDYNMLLAVLFICPKL